MHEVPRDREVVILEEGDAWFFARQPHDAGQDVLARLVRGMRFAREQHLDRPLAVVQELRQAGAILQQQVGAFVRREPPRETKRERVLVHALGLDRPRLCNREQLLLQLQVNGPQVGRWDFKHRLPAAVGAIQVPPVGADKASEQRGDLRRHPGWHMDTVRHRSDGNLRLWQSAPRVLPQPPRHCAMQPAHTDRLVGQSQRGVSGHKPVARISRTLAAEIHEAVEGDADLGQVGIEEVPHEPGLEEITPGRDRRVRREHDARTRDQPRLLQRHLSRRS